MMIGASVIDSRNELKNDGTYLVHKFIYVALPGVSRGFYSHSSVMNCSKDFLPSVLTWDAEAEFLRLDRILPLCLCK